MVCRCGHWSAPKASSNLIYLFLFAASPAEPSKRAPLEMSSRCASIRSTAKHAQKSGRDAWRRRSLIFNFLRFFVSFLPSHSFRCDARPATACDGLRHIYGRINNNNIILCHDNGFSARLSAFLIGDFRRCFHFSGSDK